MIQPRPFKITSSGSKHPRAVMNWITSIKSENPIPVAIVFHNCFQSLTIGNRKPTGMKRTMFPRKFVPILPFWISLKKEISAWNG